LIKLLKYTKYQLEVVSAWFSLQNDVTISMTFIVNSYYSVSCFKHLNPPNSLSLCLVCGGSLRYAKCSLIFTWHFILTATKH